MGSHVRKETGRHGTGVCNNILLLLTEGVRSFPCLVWSGEASGDAVAFVLGATCWSPSGRARSWHFRYPLFVYLGFMLMLPAWEKSWKVFEEAKGDVARYLWKVCVNIIWVVIWET